MKCIQKLILRQFFDDLPLLDQKTFTLTSGNTDICFSCLSRSVDNAPHDSHFDIQIVILNKVLHFVGKADQVNLGSAAGGT